MSQILVYGRKSLIHVAFVPKNTSISKALESLKGYVAERFSCRNLAKIVFNYCQMDDKFYFGLIYYDVITMTTNIA